MKILQKSLMQDGIVINYTLNYFGDNIILFVGGGEEHIGSIVLAVPRPSLADANKTSSTVSVLNVLGHKDEEIARPLAEALCVASKKPATVIAGIHFDNCNKDEIKIIQSINNKAKEDLGNWIQELID